jgi:hypothetical protein
MAFLNGIECCSQKEKQRIGKKENARIRQMGMASGSRRLLGALVWEMIEK